MFSRETIAEMQTLVDEALPEKVGFQVSTGGDSTGDVYDPVTDTWSSGTATAAVTHTSHAEAIPSDPDRFATLGLSVAQSITLRVRNEDFEPKPGMRMIWPMPDGRVYAVKAVTPIAPKGIAAPYIVDASG